MNYIEEITSRFPIRRKAEQKKAFRDWAVAEIRRMGYSVKVEQSGIACHENIIVGNPESAPVLFTAHYDTPARALLPNILLPRNPIVYLLYQLLIVLILLGGTVAVMLVAGSLTGSAEVARLLWILTYFGILMLMSFGGVANKHNANSSSGLAAVMTLMARLPQEDRGKAAFILFDNEEKGLGGSKAYAKDHQQVAYTRFTVNLDCVGVGEDFLVISRKIARQHREFACFQRHMEGVTTHRVHFFDALGSVYNATWKSFKSGVNIFACKTSPVVGFYTPDLCTAKDTEADAGNIAALAEALAACVQAMEV